MRRTDHDAEDRRPVRPPKPRLQLHYAAPVIYKREPEAPATTPLQPTALHSPIPQPKPKPGRPSYRETQRAKLQEDDLGKLIAEHVDLLNEIGWPRLLRRLRGRGDLKVNSKALRFHPARHFLQRLQSTGAPAVLRTDPWPQHILDARVNRGSHESCTEYLDFLREELLDFTRKGFWLVLPYKTVLALQKLGHLLGLRVSPMGVVPQRNRRPRIIVDLTFYDINADTINLAPKESMQFGRTLERILYLIRHSNPRYGPVYLSKVDLSDGFYRISLNDSAIAKLAVALPQFPGEEQLLALPLVLPMGWSESPPYFCAATETVADLANNWPAHITPPPHPLELVSQTPPPDAAVPGPLLDPASLPSSPDLHIAAQTSEPVPAQPLAPVDPAPPVLRPLLKPVRHTDVFVDDFIMAIQGRHHARTNQLRRLLHSIDAVFRPLDSSDPPTRKTVPSMKKFLAGDAHLSTRKVILGWLLDTVKQTIELPQHRIDRLQQIFDSLRGKTRVSTRTWHKILGELRSMSIGIPGSRGLFSLLQEGLRHTDKYRLRITPEMRDQLADFEHLASTLRDRPTELAELVTDHPIAVGPHDASGLGMGGVWLPSTTQSNIRPTLWREPFPRHIQDRLVSWANPAGDITNSDLELAGMLAQQDVLTQLVNCRGRTILPLGDNIASVVWHHKHSTTTTGPAAYLLRLNSIHQRHFRYVSKASYIPGPANQMADDCSRLWNLTDSQLLAHFNATYPQAQSWQLVTLRPEMTSSIISALQKKRPALDSLLNAPPTKTPIGGSGKPMYPPLRGSTPTSTASNHTSTYLFSKFSPRKFDTENLLPAANLSDLNAHRTTYGPSPRKSVWGPSGVAIPDMATTTPWTSN